MMQENNPSYEFIASLLKKYNGVKVDNGCGENEFKKKYDEEIIGLEIKDASQADIIVDGKKLPFGNEKVDVFLSNFVLEHVEDRKLYLEEMKRCLKKEGVVILSVPLPMWYGAYFFSPSSWLRPLREFKSFVKSPLGLFSHGHPMKHSFFYEISEWREKNYLKLFESEGLRVKERYVTCNIFSLNKRFAKVFGKVSFPDFLKVHVTFVLVK